MAALHDDIWTPENCCASGVNQQRCNKWDLTAGYANPAYLHTMKRSYYCIGRVRGNNEGEGCCDVHVKRVQLGQAGSDKRPFGFRKPEGSNHDLSGREDLNLRPLQPHCSALAGLRYAPNSTVIITERGMFDKHFALLA